MCGLVGIAGKLAFKDELTMKRLLLLDVFRGQDSTGIAGIRGNGDVKLAKLPSHPLDLFDSGKFKEALNGYQSTVFIGHNRSATRGAVTHTNSHPFQFDHITGAHNGTLETPCVLELEKELGEKFSVDSQALFAGIAKMGIENVIPMLRGAWSLTWYDAKEKSLNFLRNKERPMWYAFNKEFDHLFWASEWPMIDAAFKMAPTGCYEQYREDKTGHAYWPTDEDIHYKFDIEELKGGSKTRPKPKAKELKGKEPAPVQNSGASPFMRAGSDSTSDGMTQTGSTRTYPMYQNRTSSRSEKEKTSLNLTGSPENPFAGFFTKRRFEEIAKYGCAWCTNDVNWGDHPITVFERDDLLLCSDCSPDGGPANPDAPTRVVVRNFHLLV